MTDWSTYWHDVSTAALLGTERRTVPAHPAAGDPTVVGVRDVVLDAESHRPVPSRGDVDPARRAVRLLAAGTIARRAGVRPLASVDPLVLGATDHRSEISADVVRLWHRILADWPGLDEEFVVRVLGAGQRLAPDLVPPMLHRWRGSPVAHARVRAAAGPLADWLVGLSPGLACRGRVPSGADLCALAPLAVTPELALAVAAVDGDTADPRPLLRLVTTAVFADRIVVANAVRSLSPSGLVALLDALEPRRGEPISVGLAPAVRDLAGLRLALLRSLPSDTLSTEPEEGTSE
ncbi:MAG: hypothetical protein RJB65_2086 [Actinomycetota bacterium]